MTLNHQRGLTEPAADAAIDQACRMLRLPTLRSQFAAIADAADREQLAGFRVKYVLAAKLVNELVEAADELQLNKTITRYGRVDLLCIDELGYMELDKRGADLLFQVLTEREEKASVAIASHESFGGWTKTFTEPHARQAAEHA
jgi:DNA replication protein DnaC